MVRTYGLTHINLVVRDVERSLRFYGEVFGVEEYGRSEGLVHNKRASRKLTGSDAPAKNGC